MSFGCVNSIDGNLTTMDIVSVPYVTTGKITVDAIMAITSGKTIVLISAIVINTNL